jgi:hypothetical protein
MTKAADIVRKPSSSVMPYVPVEPKAWTDRIVERDARAILSRAGDCRAGNNLPRSRRAHHLELLRPARQRGGGICDRRGKFQAQDDQRTGRRNPQSAGRP